MEIRRPAALVGTGEIGFVVGVLLKIAENQSESVVVVFEGQESGLLTEQPIDQIHYTDGSPADLLEMP